MIVPLVGEAAWREALGELEVWRPEFRRAVVVSPHPDDETLGAGGLIAELCRRGVEVVVAAVTDGENAYAGELGLGEVRREEQSRALELLGVARGSIVRFELTDSGVTAKEEELEARLLPMVNNETLLIAPWRGDFHPDHEACGRAAAKVAERTGGKLASYVFWTWHRGTPEVLRGLAVRALPLTDSDVTLKMDALACHRSQLEHASGAPILPWELLWPARLPFEVFVV
jgi:LmbE family N-acetylglucosaminyl deacetylase